MATIAEIIPRRYKKSDGVSPIEFKIDGDEYSTLFWPAVNGIPKPSEPDIRQHSESVDQEIAAEEKAAMEQSNFFVSEPDNLLKCVEVLTQTIQQIRNNVFTQTQRDKVNWQKFDNLVNKLKDNRPQT